MALWAALTDALSLFWNEGQQMRNVIVAALAVGLMSGLVVACSSGDGDAPEPTATIELTATLDATETLAPADTQVSQPTEPSSQADRVTCGTGQPSTVQQLETTLLKVGDLPPAFGGSTGGIVASRYEDLGDAYFEANVPEERFLGGYTAAYPDPELSAGRDGRFAFSSVDVFRDEEAASIRFAHPAKGDADVERSVESRMFGANSKTLYFEVSGTPSIVGYVILIRTGRVVVGISSAGSLGDAAPLEDSEQLAALVCGRLAALD